MQVIVMLALFVAALSGALLYNHAEAPAEVLLETATSTIDEHGANTRPQPTASSPEESTAPESTAEAEPTVSEPASEGNRDEAREDEFPPAEDVVLRSQPLETPPATKTEEPPRVSKPLVVKETAPPSSVLRPELYADGVLGYTNAARFSSGLELYTANPILNRMAERKMRDMFKRQYFAHDAPDGRDVSNLAEEEGYGYLLVGENLAVGGFRDNEHLVDAWLDSPGHRANILSRDFTEIGIAVGKGTYQGDELWMAVQAFGLPRDACPAPDGTLVTRIEEDEVRLEDLSVRIDELEALAQDTSQSSPLFRERYDAYMAAVKYYNKIIEAQRDRVASYNAEVKNYNDCLEDLRQ